MHELVGSHLLRTEALPFELSPQPSADRALVIVESRPCFFLPHVVASAVRTHPGWRLYVFAPPPVHALLRKHCNNYHLATQVTLDSHPRMTSRQYSHLLMSADFWGVVREEHALVFQTDCVLVRGTPDRFMGFDFVGAVSGCLDPATFVMNGGLSLRRRSAMLRAVDLLRAGPPEALDDPEDVAFCAVMRAHRHLFTLPSMGECMEFAVESLGDAGKAIGMHGTDKYYAPTELVEELLAAAAAAAEDANIMSVVP